MNKRDKGRKQNNEELMAQLERNNVQLLVSGNEGEKIQFNMKANP